MARTQAMIGYGTILEIHDGDSPGDYQIAGEIKNTTPPNEQADQVEATHSQSPNRTKEYIVGLIEGGETSVELNFIPGSVGDVFIREWKSSGETRNVRITYPNGSTEIFPANYLGYEKSTPTADVMGATLSMKVAGAVEYADV